VARQWHSPHSRFGQRGGHRSIFEEVDKGTIEPGQIAYQRSGLSAFRAALP